MGDNVPTEAMWGVLFAVPGTSCSGAEVAYRNIEQALRRQCPHVKICWAYTSAGIRKKLDRDGRNVPAPHEALAAMRRDGITHVVVQPLHIAPGTEFSELCAEAEPFQSGADAFEDVVVGQPLLACREDVLLVTRTILAQSAVSRARREALVLVAHGSRHPTASAAYQEVASELAALDDEQVFLGTLMGEPGLDVVLRQCRDAGIHKAWLAPLTVAAGHSARMDIAGDGEGSWRQRFAAAGIETVPVVKGLGEYDDIVAIWTSRVTQALDELAHGPAAEAIE